MVNINQSANLDNNVNVVESIKGNKFWPPVLPTPAGWRVWNGDYGYLAPGIPFPAGSTTEFTQTWDSSGFIGSITAKPD